MPHKAELREKIYCSTALSEKGFQSFNRLMFINHLFSFTFHSLIIGKSHIQSLALIKSFTFIDRKYCLCIHIWVRLALFMLVRLPSTAVTVNHKTIFYNSQVFNCKYFSFYVSLVRLYAFCFCSHQSIAAENPWGKHLFGRSHRRYFLTFLAISRFSLFACDSRWAENVSAHRARFSQASEKNFFHQQTLFI